MEPYLKHIKKFHHRRAIASFRIGAHKLEIETGRYVNHNNEKYVSEYVER